jgi:hypothetical protein
LGYDAPLVSLIMLAKSPLVLTAEGFELGLELP